MEAPKMLVPIATLGFVAFVALWVIGRGRGRLAVAATTFSRPTSPVDEAERVLARRYARGAITAHEYARMMAVLRH
jgi:uncharacterized membrane protein